MNTLKERHVDREGFNWTIEVREVKRHGPVAKQAELRRNGERWMTVQLMHNGATKELKFLPYCVAPFSVMTEVYKDLGL